MRLHFVDADADEVKSGASQGRVLVERLEFVVLKDKYGLIQYELGVPEFADPVGEPEAVVQSARPVKTKRDLTNNEQQVEILKGFGAGMDTLKPLCPASLEKFQKPGMMDDARGVGVCITGSNIVAGKKIGGIIHWVRSSTQHRQERHNLHRRQF